MREDRFQPVQNSRGVILRAVRRVIAVSIRAFHAHLQTIGRLAGFHDRVRRRTEIAPYAVIFFKVHERLVGGEDMHVVGKGADR